MLAAVDPENLVRRAIRRQGQELRIAETRLQLGDYRRVHCLAAGKAAAAMCRGLRPEIRDRLAGGIAVTPPGRARVPGPVSRRTGDHPVPGRRSLAATQALLNYIATQVGPEDLVFFLLSGGASSLLAAPRPGIRARDLTGLGHALVACGAPIDEINRVRSVFCRIKSGGLARCIHPATLWTLAISDVPTAPVETIGSGPTAPVTPASIDEARQVLLDNGLARFAPLLQRLSASGPPGPLPPGGYLIIGDNSTALEAGRLAAEEKGFFATILTGRLQGAVPAAARRLDRVMRRCRDHSRPRAWLFGGETTLRVTGTGKGGRNQELALRLLWHLRSMPGPWYAACMGSDGIDGNSPAAGAWISHAAVPRLAGRENALQAALQNNDTYRFLRRFGGLIRTGATGTNIMDLGVILLP